MKQFWLDKVKSWKNKWSIFKEQNIEDDSKGVNLYKFMEVFNQNLKEDSVVVSDAGSSFYVVGQALKMKKNGRWIVSCSQAELGSGIGIATGCSFARKKGEILLIQGDGSFCTNMNQLAVIRKHNLPIKIFIWNNGHYLTNYNTQMKFNEGRLIGTGPESGLWFPNFQKAAESFEISYSKIDKISQLDDGIKKALELNEPHICEIICPKIQEVIPSADAIKDKDGKLVSLPLSKMYPQIANIDEEIINE